MKVSIYEMDYSVSPGGINCWEADVQIGLGHTINYSDAETAGDLLNYIIKQYPGVPLEVDIKSLEAYNLEQERE